MPELSSCAWTRDAITQPATRRGGIRVPGTRPTHGRGETGRHGQETLSRPALGGGAHLDLAILVQYDKRVCNYIGLIQLACDLPWYRRQRQLKFCVCFLILQPHNCPDRPYRLSISLVSSLANKRTEAKFDGLQGPTALEVDAANCRFSHPVASGLPEWGGVGFQPPGQAQGEHFHRVIQRRVQAGMPERELVPTPRGC